MGFQSIPEAEDGQLVYRARTKWKPQEPPKSLRNHPLQWLQETGCRPCLFVRRPQGGAPFAVPIARDFDFPRPATDRTVLYESLPFSSTIIDVQLHIFAAVGTTEW